MVGACEVWPSWGNSFLGCHGGFRQHLQRAVRWYKMAKESLPREVLLFVAGNDLWDGVDAEAVAAAVDELLACAEEEGTRLTIVDVIPSDYHIY